MRISARALAKKISPPNFGMFYAVTSNGACQAITVQTISQVRGIFAADIRIPYWKARQFYEAARIETSVTESP